MWVIAPGPADLKAYCTPRRSPHTGHPTQVYPTPVQGQWQGQVQVQVQGQGQELHRKPQNRVASSHLNPDKLYEISFQKKRGCPFQGHRAAGDRRKRPDTLPGAVALRLCSNTAAEFVNHGGPTRRPPLHLEATAEQAAILCPQGE